MPSENEFQANEVIVSQFMQTRAEIEKKLEKLDDLIRIQGSEGNWNVSPYMTGLYNGLILARSVFSGEEPDFRKTPKKKTLFRSILGR